MDANIIIENLLERIKGLTKENAFLVAQLQHTEEQLKHEVQAREAQRENQKDVTGNA